MNKNQSKKDQKDAEFGLDSRYTSKNEYAAEASALMEARLNRMKNLTKDQIIRAKLMQLKLQMEEYIRQPIHDHQNQFSRFLKTYIDAIYTTRNGFAQDINITPVRLSQLLNNHRTPQDEFFMKLMIHSEMVYQKVCDFKKTTWYQVYFHEKISDTILNQDKWRPKLEKDVKLSETL
ncbi:MAG: hypothetical protein KDC49_12860 [Saprospiraceae bacterium]|nr:hypothetical protein [Saprospiraceae bacterium]